MLKSVAFAFCYYGNTKFIMPEIKLYISRFDAIESKIRNFT